MHFPKYWAKASAEDADSMMRTVWRSSDESVADAEAKAREAVAQCLARAQAGADSDGYPYPDRLVREPVLRELETGDPRCRAVITRTRYGSEVLNSDAAMFVDIDLPEPPKPASGPGFLQRLFGARPAEPAPPAPDPAAGSLRVLADWQRARPDWTFRVYRTFAGFRYLATSGIHDPAAPGTHAILASLGCDPRYVQLCRAQKSFRARLNPKPWRCELPPPGITFPYPTPQHEQSLARWVAEYDRVSAGYAVCQFIATVGAQPIHPAIARIVEEHDRCTAAASCRPLA